MNLSLSEGLSVRMCTSTGRGLLFVLVPTCRQRHPSPLRPPCSSYLPLFLPLGFLLFHPFLPLRRVSSQSSDLQRSGLPSSPRRSVPRAQICISRTHTGQRNRPG